MGAQGPPWGGRIDDLVAAAYKVPAAAVRWRDPTRRPPIARAADLTEILKEVMAAAGHQSIELHQLVVVIMLRFPATLDPQSRTIDADSDAIPASEPTPELELDAQREASELATAAASAGAHDGAGPRRHSGAGRADPSVRRPVAAVTRVSWREPAWFVRPALRLRFVAELGGTGVPVPGHQPTPGRAP